MLRVVFLLELDASGVRTVIRVEAVIALACCVLCGCHPRVLPCDILPRKHYGLSVIEYQLAAYGEGTKGLREVAWALAGEQTPAHTTIHAWTESMGAYVLGREQGEVAGGTPHAALVAETEARVPAARDVPVPAVDGCRYRSEARRERLAAGAHLLAVAAVATGVSSPFALVAWCALALVWGLPSPLLFRSGVSSTRLEQVVGPSRARSPPQ